MPLISSKFILVCKRKARLYNVMYKRILSVLMYIIHFYIIVFCRGFSINLIIFNNKNTDKLNCLAIMCEYFITIIFAMVYVVEAGSIKLPINPFLHLQNQPSTFFTLSIITSLSVHIEESNLQSAKKVIIHYYKKKISSEFSNNRQEVQNQNEI